MPDGRSSTPRPVSVRISTSSRLSTGRSSEGPPPGTVDAAVRTRALRAGTSSSPAAAHEHARQPVESERSARVPAQPGRSAA
jgi:hypothetical protein